MKLNEKSHSSFPKNLEVTKIANIAELDVEAAQVLDDIHSMRNREI